MLFSVLLVLAVVLQPRSSHANSTVDLIVDALAASGAAAGVPVGDTEKDIVKSVIRDVVNNKPITEALKNAAMAPLINNLPPEVQNAANCLAGNVNPVECARRELPSAAACMAGGTDPAICAQRELINRLPPEARAAADCLATSAKVAECAERHVKGAAADAIKTLENAARGQADKHFKPAPSAITNILNIVDGVQRDDWQKVIENGGAAVAKFIIRETLGKLIPPLMPLAGPIIDVVVENRIDLASDLVKAAKNQDIPQATQVIIEAYLTMHIEMQCALPLIPDVIRETVCGALGEVIRAIGGVAGGITSDVVRIIERAIKDPLSLPGEVIDWLTSPFDGLRDDCGTAERYYSNRFAACYSASAYKKFTGVEGEKGFVTFEVALNGQCREYFAQCFKDTKMLDAICNPMRRLFNEHVNKLEAGVRSAADTYSRELRNFVEARGEETCNPEFKNYAYYEFIWRCRTALDRQVPLKAPIDGFPQEAEDMHGSFNPAPNCGPDRPASEGKLYGASVSDMVCRMAAPQEKFAGAAQAVCRKYVANADVPTRLDPEALRCLAGQVPVDGRCVSSGVTAPNTPISPTLGPCKEGEVRFLGQCTPVTASGVPLKPDLPVGPIAAPGGGKPSAGLFEGGPQMPGSECEGGRFAGGVCNCPTGRRPVSFASRTICMNAEGGAPPGITIPGGTAGNARTGGGGFDGTACAGNKVRNASRSCECAPGTVWNGNRCVAGGTATSRPGSGGGFDGVVGPVCAGNMVRTMQGECVCRTGTVWTGNSCVPGGTAVSAPPPQCPSGMLGTPPNCYYVRQPPIVRTTPTAPSSGGFDMVQPGGRAPAGAQPSVNLNEGNAARSGSGKSIIIPVKPRVGDAAPSAGTGPAQNTLSSGGGRGPLGKRTKPAASDHQEFGGGYNPSRGPTLPK